ncbi:MAG: hypothetical protein KC435_11240 [Thermomicrobiales bacterium]|nr:hypothetical protein [Thermomicrobiales bacterium]
MQRFLPKTQTGRDIGLLAVLIVPLIIAGVIWGMNGDFWEDVELVTPTPVVTPATPMASPVAWLQLP